MNVYYNAGESERYWVHVSRPDGSGLQLQPGEEVRLDLPADFSDPYLKLKVAADNLADGMKQIADAGERAATALAAMTDAATDAPSNDADPDTTEA